MEDSQSLGLFFVGFAGLFGQELPAAAELLGNLGIVFVGGHLDDLELAGVGVALELRRRDAPVTEAGQKPFSDCGGFFAGFALHQRS